MFIKASTFRRLASPKEGIAFLGILVFALGTILFFARLRNPSSLTDAASLGTQPIVAPGITRLKPHARLKLPFAIDELSEIEKRLKLTPDKVVSLSRWLHLAHVFTLNVAQDYRGETIHAYDLFTNADLATRYFGVSLFGPTPHGTRFRGSGRAQEERLTQEIHRDQILSLFAEQGLPPSTRLQFGEQASEIHHVIRDSIANFYLLQEELEWTAIAFALYMPPVSRWTNKFGVQSSFDDLTVALMDCSLDSHSCAGMHVISALTILYRVDNESCTILCDQVRGRLIRDLRRFVQVAIDSQHDDGSWNSSWHKYRVGGNDRPLQSDLATTLLATSHIAEWLLALPSDFNVPDATLVSAANWIRRTLSSASEDFIDDHFCPVCHGTHVLLQMTNVER